jgi:hypothetical protein
MWAWLLVYKEEVQRLKNITILKSDTRKLLQELCWQMTGFFFFFCIIKFAMNLRKIPFSELEARAGTIIKTGIGS